MITNYEINNCLISYGCEENFGDDVKAAIFWLFKKGVYNHLIGSNYEDTLFNLQKLNVHCDSGKRNVILLKNIISENIFNSGDLQSNKKIEKSYSSTIH